MKIGIFGSSFNPVHIGHLVTCDQARIRLGLDKVYLVPTANPYHKKVDLLDYELRYEMTEKTIADNKYLQMSDVEKNIQGNSYSYDVVKLLMEEDNDYYFIMGSDSLNGLDTWHRYEDFLNLVNLVVFKRPGYDLKEGLLEKYRSMTDKEIHYFQDLQIEISSSQIRNNIKEGNIPRYLLHDYTIEFLRGKSLW